MDRLASGTQKAYDVAYEGQLRWWRLFCARRGVSWLLQGKDPQADEVLLVDFLLHTAVNGGRAPGTLKMRLAAIKSAHVSLGLKDPLEQKPRLLLIMAGFKKRCAAMPRPQGAYRSRPTCRFSFLGSCRSLTLKRHPAFGSPSVLGISSCCGHLNFSRLCTSQGRAT